MLSYKFVVFNFIPVIILLIFSIYYGPTTSFKDLGIALLIIFFN